MSALALAVSAIPVSILLLYVIVCVAMIAKSGSKLQWWCTLSAIGMFLIAAGSACAAIILAAARYL